MANSLPITVVSEMEWDHEVDVVCTDAGVAGLAAAISAVDEGAEVYIASAPTPAHEGWFPTDSHDPETAGYLAELTGDLTVAVLPRTDETLPIGLVVEPAVSPGRMIAPFVGSQLRDWAARCIPAPSGYLYTRVTDWTSASLQAGDGEAIEVTEIGSMTVGPGDVAGSVLAWLETEAATRGVHGDPVAGVERLVFDEGQVIGAVFATADGPFAVRARHGVLVSRDAFPAGRVTRLPAALTDAVMRVALVSKAASRFGRVELLTSDPDVVRASAATSGPPSGALEHA